MVQDTSNPNAGADPFDMEEADPAKTDAQSSSLWELRALSQHYHPTVSRFSTVFDKPINPQREPYEVKDFLNQTYETEFKAQITKKGKGGVPLTFKSTGKFISEEEQEKQFPCWDLSL